ncbi:hypothetical protein TNCV_3127791 [Trichonephila clavipes]|nr:hypothetical protein TNCV_3127791 [Trichonephila clavipes]
MASSQEQGQVVAWFIEFKSVTHAHRRWGTTTLEFGSEKNFLRHWMERRPVTRFNRLSTTNPLGESLG